MNWVHQTTMKLDSLLCRQEDILDRMDLIAWCEVSTLTICCLTMILLIILAWRLK